MNEIKITLSIPGLPEAINNLAEAIRGNGVSVPTGSAPKAVEATQPGAVANADVPQTPVNPTPAAQQNTAAVTPATAVTPSAPIAPAPSEAAVNYTIEQLSVAGAALCEQGKMAQLIALLGKYGVQAVTQLKPTPDVLNPFAAELKALGANL
ncbi:MAG: hypothetical protein IJV68_04405 [Clostridia bacterium]|nr:hypothetical protein [Clostridia bacterium]